MKRAKHYYIIKVIITVVSYNHIMSCKKHYYYLWEFQPNATPIFD